MIVFFRLLIRLHGIFFIFVRMKQTLLQRRFLGWSIHAVSWLLIFGSPLVFLDRRSDIDWMRFLLHSCVPVCYFFIFYLNYLWLVPRCLFRHETRKYVLVNGVVIVCLSVLLHVLMESFSTPPPPEAVHHFPPRWIFYLRDAGMMVFVAGLGAAIRTSLRWRQTEEQLMEAEKQKTEAELKNLKNQLNPHFLLNTLNNIYALIAFDSDRAQEAVQELSKLLRHVLYDNQQSFVPLEKELDFIRNYVSLMRIRLSQQVELSVHLEAGPDSTLQVAPLLFISLIENAFKHGISPGARCFVYLSITGHDDGTVRCEIMNSHHPKSANDHSGSGVGLQQVARRLELLYPGRYEWVKGVREDGQVYVSSLTLKTRSL